MYATPYVEGSATEGGMWVGTVAHFEENNSPQMQGCRRQGDVEALLRAEALSVAVSAIYLLPGTRLGVLQLHLMEVS